MGAQCSKGNNKLSYRIHFLEVDKEGHLTLLHHLRLRLGQVVRLLPRIAFFVEEISTELRDEENWYFGGRCSTRAYFKYFYESTDGIVFVIDSNDKEDLDNALDKMERYILKDIHTENKVMMILANRQDVEGALSLEKIECKVKEKINALEPTLGGRILFLKGCNSETKMGLKEAFSWLLEIVHQHKEGKVTPGYHSIIENDVAGKEEDHSLFHSLKKVFDVSYMKSILLH